MKEIIQPNSNTTLQPTGERRLTEAEFQHLAAVPAAVEWFANIDNPRTRRGYQNDLEDFCGFVGLTGTEEFRAVTRGHVLAWRAQLEARGLAGATIRRKLAALANLFDHLLESKPFQEAIRCTALNGPGLKPTKSKSVHIRPHARDLYPSG